MKTKSTREAEGEICEPLAKRLPSNTNKKAKQEVGAKSRPLLKKIGDKIKC